MDEDHGTDLLSVQTSHTCNYDCKNCNRFFECTSPFKVHIFSQGRVDEILRNIKDINSVLVIMGGKGGVGKSTLSSQLAMSLALQGFSVGIIDCDFHGPSIPSLLGIKEGERLVWGEEGIIPVEGRWGIKVVSAHFLVEKKESLTWFDSLKREALEGFLTHVCFGELDFLIIDLPPGTGSETVNLFKYLPSEKIGVLIVTTPSNLARGVARRCISLCKTIPVRILGLVENMAGFTCPVCGYVSSIFMSGAARKLADEEGIRFLQSIPLDVRLRESADKGNSVVANYPDSPSSQSFLNLVKKIAGGRKAKPAARPTSPKAPDRCKIEAMPEVLEMNMDFGCGDRRCDDCSKYFECAFVGKKMQFEGVRCDKISKRMSLIKKKVAVVSGKGGVGKSTISVNLALSLASKGYRVGLLDSDFHGPCIPKLLGLQEKRMIKTGNGIRPVSGPLGVKVISMGFLLENDQAITWFHETKRGALGDFLAEVEYGELDCLIIDLPPGTGSENYNILRELPELDGVVAVTIPSLLSRQIVERGLSLYFKAGVPMLGVIVNMAGFICPRCNSLSEVFSKVNGKMLKEELGISLLGEIPMDEKIAQESEKGRPFVIEHPDSPITSSIAKISEVIMNDSKSKIRREDQQR